MGQGVCKILKGVGGMKDYDKQNCIVLLYSCIAGKYEDQKSNKVYDLVYTVYSSIISTLQLFYSKYSHVCFTILIHYSLGMIQ